MWRKALSFLYFAEVGPGTRDRLCTRFLSALHNHDYYRFRFMDKII
ncbi:hypothetical protein Javan119_0041 [Streptococcus phage Javan119]|nr:hypothetical protein Javan119_0041 [Streptococcus phage Javan119]